MNGHNNMLVFLYLRTNVHFTIYNEQIFCYINKRTDVSLTVKGTGECND